MPLRKQQNIAQRAEKDIFLLEGDCICKVTTAPNQHMSVHEQKKRGNESGRVGPLPHGQPFVEASAEDLGISAAVAETT
jgi:hypothetical protein